MPDQQGTKVLSTCRAPIHLFTCLSPCITSGYVVNTGNTTEHRSDILPALDGAHSRLVKVVNRHILYGMKNAIMREAWGACLHIAMEFRGPSRPLRKRCCPEGCGVNQ